MNREEDLDTQAVQAEKSWIEFCGYTLKNGDVESIFKKGAEWADAHPKKANGCKYCMGEIKQEYKMVGYSRKGRPKYENVDVRKPVNFGDSCNMTISANLLRMDYDAYSCDSSFLNEILINYCPFCGRRLNSL